jgi:peptide/histidine transporter 3/4
MKNKPYHKAKKKKEPFELIHMNTVSTPDISIYGNKYFLTILDDYARYSWVFFIKKKKKSEV